MSLLKFVLKSINDPHLLGKLFVFLLALSFKVTDTSLKFLNGGLEPGYFFLGGLKAILKVGLLFFVFGGFLSLLIKSLSYLTDLLGQLLDVLFL